MVDFKETKYEDLDVSNLFTDREEKKVGRSLMKKYLRDYAIESVSDRNTLKQLVYLEILHSERLQRQANEQFEKHQATTPQLMKAIHDNLKQILELKGSLQLLHDKTSKAASDTYKAFETLKRKAKVWRDNNQASRAMKCPLCSKHIMLKIRADVWEAQKHPYFKDKLLGNEHLIKLFKEKKLTEVDLSSILQCSPDYITWLISKW